MPDCPVCIDGFTAAGGCALLEDLVSGVTTDDTALMAAIPAGCEEAGDDCGADALAECGMDPAMFDEPMPEDDWGSMEVRSILLLAEGALRRSRRARPAWLS